MKKKPGRKSSKRRRRQRKRILIVICVLVLIFIAGIIIWKSVNLKKKSDVQNESDRTEPEDIEEDTGLDFPYVLEDGKLEVSSIFQFSGSNPDCQDMEGENIASLSIRNTSEDHLVYAKVKATLKDGTARCFEVKDIPAGQSAMVFSLDNTGYEMSNYCEEISCEAEFEEESPLMKDKLSVEVQETEITVTNISDQDVNNLVVGCHCLLDEAYFGGLTYNYPIESIPAGESVMVEATDCYLGEAAVVRIDQGE